MQDIYQNRYKKLMLIPLLLVIPMLILVVIYPGVTQGVDMTGGNVLIIRSEKPIPEAQLISVLKENFSLQELKVSTINSPTGFGAWVQYSRDPIASSAEEIISKASETVDDENQSIIYSNQALAALGKPEQKFVNSKTALIAAQDALSAYKEVMSKKLQDTISQKLGLGDKAEFQKREITPTLGAASFGASMFIAVLGGILIMIVVFLAFRQLIPSLAIIEAMLFDILAGLVGMAILNVPFSLTSLSALLLLIGYSIDTDIMLTSRLLKSREAGTNGQKATAAMKTGITMTSTTLAALVVMIAVSYFYQIEVIYQISAILFFGLLGDITATWFLNAPVLLWFLDRREKKRHAQ
ncbi:MAG: hypothetical protein NTY48_06970 [Candidatus Diapherotrites archaeon]|nr:hypothetical protein [Candidatus Diapherotrites archaeon]